MEDKLFELFFDETEITWQSIIQELVKSNEMNPWDIDVSVLTNKYLQAIKKLKEHNFRITGKVLLAAALLLKMKSKQLVESDMSAFDQMLAEPEEVDEEGFYDDLEYGQQSWSKDQLPPLIPRTPQPRKRKVSMYDLVGALEQAFNVKRRRVLANIPTRGPTVPTKKIDIGAAINDIYSSIKNYFKEKETLTFSQLLPKDASREDKVFTFLPLLYLTNYGKIDLEQEEAFADFQIILLKANKEIDKELGLA